MKTPKHWRIGQTIWNFTAWLHTEKKIPIGQMGEKFADIFFIEDDLWEKYYKEYLDTLEVTYETDEL